MLCRELLLPLFPVQRGRSRGEGRKTNVGQVGNLRGGWLPPPVHREGGRGRLPIGRRIPTCPTKSRPPTDARSVFHGISRAEGPFKLGRKNRGEKPHPLTPGHPLELARLLRDSRACGVP